MKLRYARLLTKRFDETFDFYRKKLGLPVTWGKKGDVYASFDAGDGISIALFDGQLMDSHISHITLSREAVHDKIQLVFAVDDINGIYRRLREEGVALLNEPHDMPNWGIRCLHLRDPEGNLIELNQELPKSRWSKELLDEEQEYLEDL